MLPLRLLVLAAAATVAVPAAPREALVRYVLVEARRSVSPAGEQASAVRGTVTVLGSVARWDLESGTFPRTKAGSIVLGPRNGWLLDRKADVAAPAAPADLQALFVSPSDGEAGPFRSDVRDVKVTSEPAQTGPAFQGRRTSRRVVSATWSLVTTSPGRVSRIGSRLVATFDLLDAAPAGAASPLDDAGRLLDVPEAVRAALAPELAALGGWSVAVKVETTSEESVGFPGMDAPAPGGRPPLRTRVETTRAVSDLESRPAVAADRARFELAEKTRVVGIERLVEPRETLR